MASLVQKLGERALEKIKNAQRDLGDDLGGFSATDLLLDQIPEIDHEAAVALVYYAEQQIPSLPRRYTVRGITS
jgi:hypothetical protein